MRQLTAFYILFLQPIWTEMVIWIWLLHQLIMTELIGMKMMVLQTLILQLRTLLLAQTVQDVFLSPIWTMMVIWISFPHQRVIIQLLGMKMMVLQILILQL